MAEFKTVVKEYQRMCRTVQACADCPIYKYKNVGSSCDSILIYKTEEAEKLIMDWAKANPSITNQKKFKDTFGFDYKDRFGASESMMEWLKEEYKKEDFQF